MSERSRETRPRAFLRFAGIVVAFGLTIVAAWMIALGHSQREVSLGVITGLWAALIGAMTFYSGRHGSPTSTSSGTGGSDVELRQDFALELQREVSARRAYEQQLHEMVRREIETIQRVVGDQLGRLREDVATLRSDLVDQVGGKIRLERIETTRVIGSDIEALQNEVRQLAGTRVTDERGKSSSSRVFEAEAADRSPTPTIATGQPGSIRASANTIDLPAAPPPAAQPAQPAYQPYIAPTYAPAVTYSADTAGQPVPQYSAPAAAREPIEPPPLAPVAPMAPAAAAAPSAPTAPTGPSAPPVPTFTPIAPLPRLDVPAMPAAPSVPSYESSRPAPAPANGTSTNGTSTNGMGVNGGSYSDVDSSDPFASLPRLSQFNDFDDFDSPGSASDWQSPAPAESPPWSAPASYPPANAAPADSPYSPIANGRRHGATEDDQPPPPAPESAGGRRRRADGETNDVLARLLGDR